MMFTIGSFISNRQNITAGYDFRSLLGKCMLIMTLTRVHCEKHPDDRQHNTHNGCYRDILPGFRGKFKSFFDYFHYRVFNALLTVFAEPVRT